jgi:3-hydroxybutyryl-CoA dehydrogenase
MAQAHIIPEAIASQVQIRQAERTIGIVGAGPVGHGIAQVALRRGFRVRLVDPRPGAAHRALAEVEDALDWLRARGRLNREAFSASSALKDLDGADLVIVDASSGAGDGTLAMIRDLDAALDPQTILAVHTCETSVTKLAAEARHPERVIGLHFMEPVAVADVVEVVRAVQTSDAAHDEALWIVRGLGKTVVSTLDRPGFLAHRMLIPFINEACFALQEGLGSVEDIDTAVRLGPEAMGPLRMADEIGLDRCLFLAELFQREFGDSKYRPSPLLRNYVAAGWLGRKSGRGFYVYP